MVKQYQFNIYKCNRTLNMRVISILHESYCQSTVDQSWRLYCQKNYKVLNFIPEIPQTDFWLCIIKSINYKHCIKMNYSLKKRSFCDKIDSVTHVKNMSNKLNKNILYIKLLFHKSNLY
jgi:hypothetical protein